jgi:hypothetical protein
MNRPIAKPRQMPVPALVPIARSVQQNGLASSNGFGADPAPRRRRSVLDFTKKNRVS